MGFIDSIVTYFNNASSYFYSIYLEVYGWVYPFWLTAYWFYYLSVTFSNLAWQFYYFGLWVDDVAAKVSEILSWSTIQSYITSWFYYISNLSTIFYYFVTNVTSVVTSWWSSMQGTVQGWISIAVQPFNAMLTAWTNFWNNLWPQLTASFNSLKAAWGNFWNNLWPQLTASFNSLKAAWDNFWLVTLPNLVSFTWLTTWWNSRLVDVDKLIKDTLKDWFPFYDDLAGLWTTIALFFTDPVEFIWQRFADWFLGPEE